MRPFISLSCSREDDRLVSSARGSFCRRVDETIYLSVLFPENALDWEVIVVFTF
jgi:hypothetical protein